jgi:phosphonate transport system ATP-binding protein
MCQDWIRHLQLADQVAIGFQSIGKRYGHLQALSGVNLSIYQGSLVALIGKSGSGKSTLLKLVNQMETASSGQITILGKSLQDPASSGRELRKRVATIHQGLALVPRLSALENTMQGALTHLRAPRLGAFSYPVSLRTQALDLLAELGLSDKSLEPVVNLSGGQQQRVAVARALMQQPQILLADEPISALDPQTSKQVLQLFKSVAQDRGLTLLIAIHQVEFVDSFADRIIGLQSGQIVLDSEVSKFDKSAMAKLFGDANA